MKGGRVGKQYNANPNINMQWLRQNSQRTRDDAALLKWLFNGETLPMATVATGIA